jgi:four helix bundle protein
MATIKSFEDIEAWRMARELSKEIFKLTLLGSFSKDYSLKDQINRSSGSTMDNIAEGFERGGTKEFIHFLSIAKGSSGEVRSQLYRALDREHITENIYQSTKEKSEQISKKINAFILYLRESEIRGMKFHEPEQPYGN